VQIGPQHRPLAPPKKIGSHNDDCRRAIVRPDRPQRSK
jgi:hypothetical protein